MRVPLTNVIVIHHDWLWYIIISMQQQQPLQWTATAEAVATLISSSSSNWWAWVAVTTTVATSLAAATTSQSVWSSLPEHRVRLSEQHWCHSVSTNVRTHSYMVLKPQNIKTSRRDISMINSLIKKPLLKSKSFFMHHQADWQHYDAVLTKLNRISAEFEATREGPLRTPTDPQAGHP